jgi:magnesium-protoporphyrin IX monomethyl ester (oxidative) cyclase|tara:strand:- start:665 stop:2215 length:1551 start_codon:yes stop_codon:yes gene_type:complete
MKALLIYPPIRAYLSDTPWPDPPLGLGYIGAVIENEGFEVEILDALALGTDNVQKEGEFLRVGLSWEDLKKRVSKSSPDIVGITAAYTAYASDSHNCAKIIKEINPDIPVVFGGAHTSILYSQVLSDPNVDIAVLGEGEMTYLELMKTLKANGDIYSIDGTAVNKNSIITKNAPRPFIEELDSIPFPARHLLPMENYFHKPSFLRDYSMRKPRTNMITSRGCPFDCVFCSIHSVWGYKWRWRSAKNVVDEIELLINKYKVREIAFLDDNITLNKKRMIEICDEIIERKLDIKWCTPNGVMVRTLDQEVVGLMNKSGCWKLTLGIESGSPETQKFIGKKIDADQCRKIIEFCNKIGMWTHATFIIGFPYETLDSINQTINFAINSELDLANFYVATPYPATKLHEIYVKEKLLESDSDTSYLSINLPGTDTKYFSKKELKQMQSTAYSKFISSRMKRFLNPMRIEKKLRSFDDLQFVMKMLKTAVETRFAIGKHGSFSPHKNISMDTKHPEKGKIPV